MYAIELNMDIVDAVFSRHKPDGVCVRVNCLDETVIVCSRWSDNLPTSSDILAQSLESRKFVSKANLILNDKQGGWHQDQGKF